MRPGTFALAIALATPVASGCSPSREERVAELCMYLRPDMTLADANRLVGWQAQEFDASWYWTDRKKCVVLAAEADTIVEVYDFYRFKHYHKLLAEPGVFERDIPREDAQGNPINRGN